MPITLDTDIAHINQVGQKTAEKLAKLEVFTVKDLLFYYPFRYQDFSQVTAIDQLEPGVPATIFGRIEILKNRRSWQKKMIITEGLVSDESGSIKVIWFNQQYISKNLKPGDQIYLAGTISNDGQLISPVYERAKSDGSTIHTARLVPIYSVTSGLTQKQVRWLISIALKLVDQLVEWLPSDLMAELNLWSVQKSLAQIHFPDSDKNLEQAVRRLKFDELFMFLLQIQMIKKDSKLFSAPKIDFFETETKDFVNQLPFKLTDDQKKSAWQIIKDLANPHPMNRLLEGDVGAGKTVVSAIVAYNIILNDHQVAFMAPTEILANQHFVNFNRLLTGKKINIGLLTKGKFLFNQKVITKQKLLRALKNHQVDLLIGTHALIQEKVVFDSLALAIIDEQHRFGVEQRKILNQKSNDKNVAPHFLSMTATPIPRSLALSFYGNLDLTTIKTLPANRKKIITKVVRSKQRQKIYQFVSQEIKAGRQVFFVCPLIDPSDKLTAKSVKEEFIFLKEKIWPQFRVGLLHGRLKMEEKEKIMNQFVDHQIDILVATSVIEVGIDVPNASVMIIENAERFGLAQLHQLRGRVGRGESQSYCFLLTEKNDPKTIDRLTALTQSNNGFELAEKDLEFRGPGEFFGVSQSGWPEFRIASLFDFQFLKIVNEAVKKIIDQDPNLDNHPLLKEKVYQSRMATHLE